MEITPSSDKSFLVRLSIRFSEYSFVGIGTFITDLLIIAFMVYVLELKLALSIGIAFLFAVHMNYLINRYWVYKGTKQHALRTYMYFLAVSIVGALIIPFLVVYLNEFFGIALIFARVLVACGMGTINFLIQTFVNFKFV